MHTEVNWFCRPTSHFHPSPPFLPCDSTTHSLQVCSCSLSPPLSLFCFFFSTLGHLLNTYTHTITHRHCAIGLFICLERWLMKGQPLSYDRISWPQQPMRGWQNIDRTLNLCVGVCTRMCEVRLDSRWWASACYYCWMCVCVCVSLCLHAYMCASVLWIGTLEMKQNPYIIAYLIFVYLRIDIINKWLN